MEVASLLNTSLVSGCEQKRFRLYFSWTNAKEGCQKRFKRCCNDFVIKTTPKMFLFFWYHSPWSFEIFINMFAFLYFKENSMEICEEIFFSSFLRKMLMSAFLLRLKSNYLQKMRGYRSFSLWIPIALAKIYFFHVVLAWRENLWI